MTSSDPMKPIIVRACGSELEFKSMFVKEQKPKPDWLLVCLSCGEIFKTPAGGRGREIP